MVRPAARRPRATAPKARDLRSTSPIRKATASSSRGRSRVEAQLSLRKGKVAEMEKSPESFDVVILGAGIAGLAGALAAARMGLRPLVLEKADQVGGITV